jgi:hypothetical protein
LPPIFTEAGTSAASAGSAPPEAGALEAGALEDGALADVAGELEPDEETVTADVGLVLPPLLLLEQALSAAQAAAAKAMKGTNRLRRITKFLPRSVERGLGAAEIGSP